MRNLLLVIAFSFTLVGFSTRVAEAFPAFQKALINNHIKKLDDAAFVKVVRKKVKCYLCHQGKKHKENRNSFGDAVLKHLKKEDQGSKDKEIKAKQKIHIAKMMVKILAEKSDLKDSKSKTYGEIFAASKLPGGTLEESKKEPADGKKGHDHDDDDHDHDKDGHDHDKDDHDHDKDGHDHDHDK